MKSDFFPFTLFPYLFYLFNLVGDGKPVEGRRDLLYFKRRHLIHHLLQSLMEEKPNMNLK